MEPGFLNNDLINFLLKTDFGTIYVSETNSTVPLSTLFHQMVQLYRISNRQIVNSLISIHLKDLTCEEDGKKYFHVSKEMKQYLTPYLMSLDKFTSEQLQQIIDLGFQKSLSENEIAYLKHPEILKAVNHIQKKLE